MAKKSANKMKTNMLKRSNASSKPGRRVKNPKDTNMRSADTIKRLKMYNNGKAIRNKKGEIVGGQYMMKDRAGDTKITNTTGRIAPDRRWFGNTRVVSSKDLDAFREEMLENVADPYSVVLKRKKVPIGLLTDAIAGARNGSLSTGLLVNEPFEHTFGSKSLRKKVKLDQLLLGQEGLIARKEESKRKKDEVEIGGEATRVKVSEKACDYSSLLSVAQESHENYEHRNNEEGIVPWRRDSDMERTEGEGVDWRHERKDDLFLKGQSNRIWGEFFKVIDCSDVILHVIDARNVPGTRCRMIEDHISNNAKHKHLVFVLNKIDLVPNWVAKRWVGELAQVRPSIAFHASNTDKKNISVGFGKGALINLLRQFGQLMNDKKQISVGVVGYPNVGKSSVINALIKKKSCKVAPIPGETKIWQYIKLFKNVFLVDCPGVVVNTAGDTEVDSVLKGVVRAERLENPEDFTKDILRVVKHAYIATQYNLEIPTETKKTWNSPEDLLHLIALKLGYLMKGAEPNIRLAAVRIINDFQRGKLPHYVSPPELKTQDTGKEAQDAGNDTQDVGEETQHDPIHEQNSTKLSCDSQDCPN